MASALSFCFLNLRRVRNVLVRSFLVVVGHFHCQFDDTVREENERRELNGNGTRKLNWKSGNLGKNCSNLLSRHDFPLPIQRRLKALQAVGIEVFIAEHFLHQHSTAGRRRLCASHPAGQAAGRCSVANHAMKGLTVVAASWKNWTKKACPSVWMSLSVSLRNRTMSGHGLAARLLFVPKANIICTAHVDEFEFAMMSRLL